VGGVGKKAGQPKPSAWKLFFALSRLAGLFLFHLRKKKKGKIEVDF
jgi:hypothetical protein